MFIGRIDAKVEAPIFQPPDARADSLEKIKGRRRGQRRMRWLDGIIDSMYMS